MTSAKDLDSLKSKCESVKTNISKLEAELTELQLDLKEKARSFFEEAGIAIPTASSPVKTKSKSKSVAAGTVNQKIITEVKSLQPDRQGKITILLNTKKALAKKHGCELADVNASIREVFDEDRESPRGQCVTYKKK